MNSFEDAFLFSMAAAIADQAAQDISWGKPNSEQYNPGRKRIRPKSKSNITIVKELAA